MTLRLTLYKKRQALKRALNRALNGSCTVLLYHRIHDSDYDPQRLCVSPANFRSHLLWLKKNYKVLTVDQFDRALKRGKFPRKSALITFDDGYADNLHEALPILKETGVQALFYVATANIGNRNLFWWDELDLIFRANSDPHYLESLLKTYSLSDKKALYDLYLGLLKRASSLESRQGLMQKLRRLAQPVEAEQSQYRSLDIDELKHFAGSSNVVIGAHTVNHLSLGALQRDEQLKEMSQSVSFLENCLKKKILHFSFPYGEAQDFNSDTIELSSTMQFSSAAANYSGIVSRGVNPFAFPRVVVRNGNPESLASTIRAAQ